MRQHVPHVSQCLGVLRAFQPAPILHRLVPATPRQRQLLCYRDFGQRLDFSGQAVTIKCFENNPLVREVRKAWPAAPATLYAIGVPNLSMKTLSLNRRHVFCSRIIFELSWVICHRCWGSQAGARCLLWMAEAPCAVRSWGTK